MNSVLAFVIEKYVSTERYREGMRNGTRASFHMELTEIAPLLNFMLKKESLTPEQARDRFVTMRDNAVRLKAKSPKEMGVFTGGLISLALAVAIGFLSVILFARDSIWSETVGVIVGAVFFVLFSFLLAWRPRNGAMNMVWSGDGTFEEKLEGLYQVSEMPMGQIIGKYQKKQTVVFVVFALIVLILLPFMKIKGVRGEIAFHDALAGVTVSADNNGTRYAVYSKDEDMFVDRYLKDEYQALTAEDVRAVLYIDEGEKVVGRYEGQGNAYQRYITITLVDQRTGQMVYSETVYGGDPPRSISTKIGSKNQSGYGSAPAVKDIEKVCERMILNFERSN